MSASKTDFFPLLAILTGGALGVAVTGAMIASFADSGDPVPAVWSSGEASTWVMSVDLGPAGSGDPRFELTRNGDRITGSYRGAMGRGLPVEGTVTDGRFELSFDSDQGEVVYEGTLDGVRVSGRSAYGALGSGTFEGRRRR
jgi:hypothetical protein